MNGERLFECRERIGVFELRILRGAETHERARHPVVVAKLALDRDRLFVDRLRRGKVTLVIQRVGEILERVRLQLLVSDSNGKLQRAFVKRLCARIVQSLRGSVGLT